MLWKWVIKFLGLEDPLSPRLDVLEKRMRHNDASLQGAINAFKQFAKDAER